VPWLGVTVAVKVTGFPTNEGDPEVTNTVFVGTPLLTCSTSAEDTLPALFVSPEYVAVIVWVAGVVYFVVYAAWPPTIVTVATVDPPSWNITVPVTAPSYWLATVAVYVTNSVMSTGLSDDAREVVVVAGFTTCGSGADTLELNFSEPWYTAVIECEPACSTEVEIDPCPFTNVALPSVVEPS
jgi:hypothetical protein